MSSNCRYKEDPLDYSNAIKPVIRSAKQESMQKSKLFNAAGSVVVHENE